MSIKEVDGGSVVDSCGDVCDNYGSLSVEKEESDSEGQSTPSNRHDFLQT